MTTPRRRVLRPARPAHNPEPRVDLRLEKWREQLTREQAGLARTMSRLKRVFHAFEKQQRRVTRLEKLLSQPNGSA